MATEPWTLIEAFLERNSRRNLAEEAAARNLEMAPVQQILDRERARFRNELELESIPRKLAAAEPYEIARSGRSLENQKALVDHTTAATEARSAATNKGRLKAIMEMYRSDPEAFKEATRRAATDRPGAWDDEPEGEVLPADPMLRDQFLRSKRKGGEVPEGDIVTFRGKAYQKFSKAQTGQTPTTNAPPIATTPKPTTNQQQKPATPVPQAAPVTPQERIIGKSPEAQGTISPESESIGDLLRPPTSGKGDRRSAVPDKLQDVQTASFGADDTDDDTSFMIKGLYKSLRNGGYSDQGAKVMLAHVGRENDFKPEFIFGNHSDPANRANNVGFFSWQKDRADKVMGELAQAGLIGPDGKIKPSQAALDIMTRHSVDEMGRMSGSLLRQLQTDDFDPDAVSRGLSKRYIKWRADDPQYASHHKRMEDWYNRIHKILAPKKPQVRATADPDIFDVLTEDMFA